MDLTAGIDTESWDPARDATLPAPFSGASPRGKALCKRFLQAGLGMSVAPDKPLVAVVSRLVPQKGIHLMEAALHHIVQHGEGLLRGEGCRENRVTLPCIPLSCTVIEICGLVPAAAASVGNRVIHVPLWPGGQFVLLGSGHADGALRRAAEEQYRWAGEGGSLWEGLAHLHSDIEPQGSWHAS